MSQIVRRAANRGGEEAQASRSARTIYVWDLPTRLFHWLLVGAVLVALLTGFVAPESWMGSTSRPAT